MNVQSRVQRGFARRDTRSNEIDVEAKRNGEKGKGPGW